MDEKDRKILSLLRENPEIRQREIARLIGISQPSVGARIKKLKERGLISYVVGTNLKKVGLYLSKVEITAKKTNEILNSFKNCPYFLNGFVTSGKYNLCLFFVSEDISTLEALVDAHIRPRPNVMEVKMSLILSMVNDFIFPLKFEFERKETPPCNYSGSCGACEYYNAGRCLGCPVTGFYRGKIWSEVKGK